MRCSPRGLRRERGWALGAERALPLKPGRDIAIVMNLLRNIKGIVRVAMPSRKVLSSPLRKMTGVLLSPPIFAISFLEHI